MVNKNQGANNDIDPDVADNLKRFLEHAEKSEKKKPSAKRKTVLTEENGDDELDITNEKMYGEEDPEEYGVSPEDFFNQVGTENTPHVEEIENPEQTPKQTPKPKITVDEVRAPSQDFYKKDRKPKGDNPLEEYFREAGTYIRLPSQGNFTEEEIDFSSNGEIAVYPMTAKDELWFKNPEALMNGDAIEKVLESCVPGISSIRDLPINDINALLLGVRLISYGSSLDMRGKCPHCNHENEFGISIEEMLAHMNFLEDEYKIETQKGLKIFIKPFTYDMAVKTALMTFEQSKLVQLFSKNEEASEEEKQRVVRESLGKIQDLGFWLTSRSVMKVTTPDKRAIRDKDNILEWLQNINMREYNKIKDKIDEVNEIGVPKKWTVDCQNEDCGKEYEIEIKYDPASFFGQGS